VCYIDRAHLTVGTNARQHARQGDR
jgi:hypothetical protein